MPEARSNIISSYSRAQALEDGMLVDIDAIDPTIKEGRPGARLEAGYKVPVAVTKRVYDECIAVNERCEGHQSIAGRLWDVMFLSRMAPGSGRNTDHHTYKFYCTRPNEPAPGAQMMGEGSSAELTELVMVIGPGDNAEPVITIMFPGED